MKCRPLFRQGLVMVLLCATLLLVACGQKGDLYLPDEPAQQEQEEEKQQ